MANFRVENKKNGTRIAHRFGYSGEMPYSSSVVQHLAIRSIDIDSVKIVNTHKRRKIEMDTQTLDSNQAPSYELKKIYMYSIAFVIGSLCIVIVLLFFYLDRQLCLLAYSTVLILLSFNSKSNRTQFHLVHLQSHRNGSVFVHRTDFFPQLITITIHLMLI